MSDNVPITQGVGTVIGAEDQLGVEYQRVVIHPALATPYTEVTINVASAGDNLLVNAFGAQKIRVYGFFMWSAGAVDVKWRDGATDYHPVGYFLGRGAFWMMPRDGTPWFTGSINTALNLNLSAAIQVSGRLYYRVAA